MNRLRIGVLVDHFPELSETFIAAEAHALEAAGHKVHTESTQHAANPNAAAAEGLSVAYGEDGTRRQNVVALAWLALRRPIGVMRDLLQRRRWRGEEPVRPLRRLAPVARRLSHARVQHLHAHFAAGAALDALRLGQLLGLPYSVATHGYDIFQHPANLRLKHEHASFAVSACDYSVRHLRTVVGPEAGARIHRVVVGVDGERFRRRTPHADGTMVLAVGRLVEKKGFRYLIEAAALRPELRVKIVGDGPLAGVLAEQVSSLGIGDRVELVGSHTPDEIRELLEDACVVAVPCVVAADGDRDTMPVIAKEALAMEVPVVASDEVGLPEIVAPAWGRLVPPRDPRALAAAIGELLACTREDRIAMGRAGRDFVLAQCNLERETERLARLIAEAVVVPRTAASRGT